MFKKLMIVIAALGLMAAAACSNKPSGTSTASATSTAPATAAVTSATFTGTTSLQIPVSGVQKAGTLRIWMVTTPAPLKPGNGVLDAYVADENGQAVDDAILTFSINMTNMNMGTNTSQPALVGPGHYNKTVRFSMAGPWRVTVTLVRGGQTYNVAFDFTVSY